MKGLKNHPIIGSLSENDQFASDKMERFWLNSKNILLDLMIDYYIATYEMYNFRKPSDAIEQDVITIHVKMDKFGRYRIGSEMFGSALSF
ncbi:hypothetical protein GLOIN_2v1786477 [Rhizophagus irregularis DAOM 181602=DAOM 197198]|uniref:Uncharacterized protein n=1 Tax=Rhizophagus irregularis (strain DAOM 197198w) TaxID=1432141 RepID=A0A015JX88_RHIIW|nr:hypothetical protein RirG_073720 [Rhizophagus irregularis DAOM 197198w]GBC44357.1 hypothetical protein GLOIN_2v1786477 [Rhizophagus irregularis DAOM 181602=DAOM 197198]